jgi:hypothetical protein
MEDGMTSQRQWRWVCASLCLNLVLSTQAYGHGEGGGVSKDTLSISFVPNPSIPEFAGATGTALVDLAEGVVALKDLKGFPINPQKNLPLTINLTSTTDPRFIGANGEPNKTSCHESNGQWTCHVHSYVVWFVGFEDGALGHVIQLGTIYPRTDGTAADRNFSFREGNISGFGTNVILITAEATFGAEPSLGQGEDGEATIETVPRGPIALQANIP